MAEAMWLIPALPMAGFIAILVMGSKLGERAGWLATAAISGSFLVTVGVFFDLLSRPAEQRSVVTTLFRWIPSGAFRVDLAFLADPLSVVMCLFVTGVGALIHLYPPAYMHGDPKFSKFFLYLNLFAASMLVLVLGSNMMVTFLGWEGVGVCSYLLISFWHTSPANAAAGKKAFITNRVGDLGFMLSMFLVWSTIGSLDYLAIDSAAHEGLIVGGVAVGIVLLAVLGATGKSAQIPLLVWLPDAMAGPTPVSALIHAATMVTSGVYLLVRMNPVLHQAGWANDVIAWVGVITALFAATVAIAQNDIKKVLAYSTVSQLGFMFLAVGTGAYVAAIFHMITHAFFKALLFLGAGSVIHGMDHEQDMRAMGGLKKFMPVTAGTFIVGWLAIAGVPPFAGFWSKDEILASAWGFHGSGKALWVLGMATALLTAFYMTRQVSMTFFGSPRWSAAGVGESGEPDSADAVGADARPDGDHDADALHVSSDHEPHESPGLMLLPLVVLAGLAIVGGGLNLPFVSATKRLEHWLEPVIANPHEPLPGSTLWPLAIVAVVVAVFGIVAGWSVYVRRRGDAARFELKAFREGWYYDSAISAFVAGPGRRLFDAISFIDRRGVDGAVNGLASAMESEGSLLARVWQSGYVRRYALTLSIGLVLVAAWFVTRMAV